MMAPLTHILANKCDCVRPMVVMATRVTQWPQVVHYAFCAFCVTDHGALTKQDVNRVPRFKYEKTGTGC